METKVPQGTRKLYIQRFLLIPDELTSEAALLTDPEIPITAIARRSADNADQLQFTAHLLADPDQHP
jgi:hypothetical protein